MSMPMPSPASRNHRRSRRGFSVVEMLVYLGVFCLILAGVAAIVTMESSVEKSLRRLDTLYELRMASWQLSRALVTGTRVLHPPVDLQTYSHQILFTDQNWMKCLVFLDGQGRLKIARWQPPAFTTGAVETLAENVVEFKTKRLAESLVLYSIKAAESGRPPFNKTFLLSNSLQLTNRTLCAMQGNL
ncbi:MAG: hypothetical protein GX442_25645 [Candidatus Riflebacteria bacterium]|nr:hypothetical protein [Candidatus Riflebacteria bacterium]